jgi:hypothetical protein
MKATHPALAKQEIHIGQVGEVKARYEVMFDNKEVLRF